MGWQEVQDDTSTEGRRVAGGKGTRLRRRVDPPKVMRLALRPATASWVLESISFLDKKDTILSRISAWGREEALKGYTFAFQAEHWARGPR
jgi:hypothetical protein